MWWRWLWEVRWHILLRRRPLPQSTACTPISHEHLGHGARTGSHAHGAFGHAASHHYRVHSTVDQMPGNAGLPNTLCTKPRACWATCVHVCERMGRGAPVAQGG